MVVCRVEKGLFGGKSASRHRKGSVQLGGSNRSADLSPSKLEGAFSVRTCHPPSWRKHFRHRLVVLQLGAANFVSEMQIVRREFCISSPENPAATCGKPFWHDNVVPQLAASYFGANLSSRNLRGQISCPRCRFPTEQWHFRSRNRGSYLSFYSFGRIHTKTNPKRPFGRPFGVRCLCSVFTVAGGFSFPFPVGRALFIVYPADDLFDRWFLAVHEHAHAVDLCPDPRHQDEASVQQADA